MITSDKVEFGNLAVSESKAQQDPKSSAAPFSLYTTTTERKRRIQLRDWQVEQPTSSPDPKDRRDTNRTQLQGPGVASGGVAIHLKDIFAEIGAPSKEGSPGNGPIVDSATTDTSRFCKSHEAAKSAMPTRVGRKQDAGLKIVFCAKNFSKSSNRFSKSQ